MALLTASSAIYANGSVEAINTTAKAAGFSHQTVKSFFKVNGRELTAQNRKFSMSVDVIGNTLTLSSGSSKRYHIGTPETYSLSYTYLPGPYSATVDGKEARDYMYSIASLDKNVLIEYLPDYTSDQTDFAYKTTLARMTKYSETLIRRDVVGRCYYYDVSIEFEGL